MCHADPIMGGAGEDVRPVEQVTLATGGEQMPAFVSRPAGNGPAPAILIISDVFGASPFYQEMAGRLANEGYLALLPDLFHRVGPLPEQTLEAAVQRMGRLTDDLLIQDLSACIDYLGDRADVEPKQPGLMGFCMGGTLVLIMGARRASDVAAGAIYYGFPVNARPSANHPVSAIDEVANIRAPMIGFWGDQDAGVGMDNVRRLQEEMGRLNKDFTCTIYPGAGHGFMARRSDADVTAAEDAWPAMLQFFDKTLRVGSVAGG
jgi:carboxymethylenebutenolidase